MKHFIGKICTVLTEPVNIQFKDFAQHAQYFTGEFVDADERGVWLKHPQAKTMAYFLFSHLVGIVEEQSLAAGDPMIEKIKEAKKPAPPKPSSTFIPVEELTKIVRK